MQVFLMSIRLKRLGDAGNKTHDIRLDQLQPEVPGFQFCQVQDLVDQIQQSLAVSGNEFPGSIGVFVNQFCHTRNNG